VSNVDRLKQQEYERHEAKAAKARREQEEVQGLVPDDGAKLPVRRRSVAERAAYQDGYISGIRTMRQSLERMEDAAVTMREIVLGERD
jgi:hypothetical protein